MAEQEDRCLTREEMLRVAMSKMDVSAFFAFVDLAIESDHPLAAKLLDLMALIYEIAGSQVRASHLIVHYIHQLFSAFDILTGHPTNNRSRYAWMIIDAIMERSR